MKDEKKITVAVVDDHDKLRGEMCKLIGQMGFQVVFDAANGALALEKLAACHSLPDVCLLDVNMPVMNGFEAAKAMKAQYPTVKIIAHSMDNDEMTVIGMFKAGASAFLSKGCRMEDLSKAITEVNDQHYYFDREAAAAFLRFIRK